MKNQLLITCQGFVFGVFLLCATQVNANPLSLAGVWQTPQSSEITIELCEAGYCGYITKIVVPPDIYEQNKDAIDAVGIDNLLDYNNKNPELRTRRMQGLQILELTELETENRIRGRVYSPEDGNTYTGIVEIIDTNVIKLTGCGFFDLICKSEEWSRSVEQ